MSITKAFLLTLLITVIESAIQVISFIGLDITGLSYEFEHVYGITIILCRIIAYTTVFYFFWRKNVEISKIELPVFKPKILIYLLLMTLGFRFIGEPFWDFNSIFRSAEITLYSFDGFNAQFFYRTFSILVIAPVLEELFFRKFLITKLLKKYSKVTAVVVSALLFSAIHWESVSNLLPTFIFGIIGGIFFIKTKRISYLILVHFLYNFLGMIINVNSVFYSEVIHWLNYGILYWSLFLFGIFVVLFALRLITNDRSLIAPKK